MDEYDKNEKEHDENEKEYDENEKELERLIKQLEEEEEENVTIFNKMANFLRKLVKKREKPRERIASKFEEFLEELDKDDEMYEIVEEVAHLCDDAIIIAREKLWIIDRLHVLDEEIKEIKCYEKLTDMEIDHLKEMLTRFVSLTQDRNALRYQITGFDKSLIRMHDLEEDAKFIVDNTQNAERQQRFLKHDLGYLEGEKSELEQEREKLLNTQQFIYKFSIALVIVSGLSITFLVFIHIFRGTNVFLPSAIMCIALIITINSMNSLKRHVKRQLIINMKKQHKAVEIFNKKAVVYTYYTNFLNFVYAKYSVRNSEKLRQNIKDYSNYKHLTTRFDAIRDMLYETEAAIETFLREKGIVNTAITTERFAKSVNIDDKRKYYAELTSEKNSMEEKLKNLDTRHNKIWSDLVLLNEEDKSPTKVIDRIIQKYIVEVNKLVNLKDEDKDTELEVSLEKTLDKIKENDFDDILKTSNFDQGKSGSSDASLNNLDSLGKIGSVGNIDSVNKVDRIDNIDNNDDFNYNDSIR